MIDDYRFFQDFYDGQIVKEESDKYKMFKIVLFSLFSVAGIFLFIAGFCSIVELALLEFGMIWNFYTKLDKKLAMGLCTIVAVLYAVISSHLMIYSNAIVYLGFYIPFQLIALCKDYSDGDFVQIKKKMTDFNLLMYFIFTSIIAAGFFLIDTYLNARFAPYDAVAAALLLASAILRNERYSEYFLFRTMALLASLVLWIVVALEYGDIGLLPIILMYLSYLIFDFVTFFVQSSTYINEYMIQVEKYKKIEDQHIINKKLSEYNKAKGVK